MATVELAVGLLTASLMALLACWAVTLVVAQARCGETAAQVARQLARADQKGADEARARAPRGASVSVERGARQVRVVVRASRSLGRLGPVRVSGEATADVEPGVRR